jgi:aminoglycoside phosphotransferase (APT) family kinase protein
LIPGGRSKETILVTLDGMPEKSHELILRKDRRIALISGKASDEYDVLKAVWDYGGVPCPRPILGEADENALGGTFLLMERVHGLRGGEYFPDLESPRAHRREIVLHFARSMAHLHAMPLELLEHTKVGKASPQPPTVDSIRADIQSFENRIEAFGYRASATLSRAFSWMYDHIDFALIDVEPRIIQGDVGLHNMIIDGPKVAALVDWELARIGSASSELGSAWHMVTALASWPEFAAEYIKHGGPPLSVDQRPVLFWRLFKAIWALCVCRDMCAMFRSGARRDIVAAGSALDSHFRHQRNVTLAVWDACNLELAN